MWCMLLIPLYQSLKLYYNALHAFFSRHLWLYLLSNRYFEIALHFGNLHKRVLYSIIWQVAIFSLQVVFVNIFHFDKYHLLHLFYIISQLYQAIFLIANMSLHSKLVPISIITWFFSFKHLIELSILIWTHFPILKPFERKGHR